MNNNIPAQLKLPLAAEQLLPHTYPMLLVDELLTFDNGNGAVSAVVDTQSLFAAADNTVEMAALIELVAQSCAAVNGYNDLINNRAVRRGFLVGSSNFHVNRRPRCGEQLRIEVNTTAVFEAFSIVDGKVLTGTECLAAGSVKLWLS